MKKTSIERRLSNVIKRNISEMALELTEEKKCDGKSNGDCLQGQFCSTFVTGQGGEGVCKGTPDGGMVTGGKGKGRGKKSYSGRLPHSKYASKNIVKSLKEDLLAEKPGCRGWFDCPVCGGGRTTCKKGGKEINTSDGGGKCGCDDTYSIGGGKSKGGKTYGKKLRQAKAASKHIMKIKESELINLVKRTLLNEQQGTPWCAYCMATSGSWNACTVQCDNNLDKDALSCQACKNLFPGSGAQTQGHIDTHCNQQGQPCYTTTTTYVSPGKGWAQAPKGSDIKARKRPDTYGGTDSTSIEIGESQLINIIKRTINESQILTEEQMCKDDMGCTSDQMCRDYSGDGIKHCVDKPPVPTSIINSGGDGEIKSFSGPWSDVANIVRQAKAAGGFNNMSEQEVLLWIRDEMEGGPGVGQKKACQGATQFGGGRCCLTIGWKKVGLKCTIGKMKK